MTPENKLMPWLKWGTIVVLAAAVGLMIYVWVTVQNIQAQKETGFAATEQTVIEKTDITTVDHIEAFHEAISYHIVFGRTQDGTNQIIFLSLDDESNITVLNSDDTLSRDAIENQWKQSCDACTLISVKAAMIESKPLWELTYKDEHGRHVFDYLSMKDGQQYEQMRFKREFK